MNGVIYARYSAGPGQTDKSIEGQVADCKAYAKRNGINIIEIYADKHVSGKSTAGRNEFLRMIKDAKKKAFECCIVWKVDRFGRDRRDIAIYKHELKTAGVKLLYAEESVPEGPEGIILESVLEGLAEYYSADLKQKVTRGIRETVKKGEWCMPLPIGYTTDENRHIKIKEPEATGIRKCFELHNLDAPTQEIVDMFNSLGIKGKKGNSIASGTIWRILRNERYTGKFEVQGVAVPAPAIIDQETFEEAKKHFKTSRHNGRNKALVNYMLSGKCYCGECGSLLHGSSGYSHTGQAYNYYKCVNKDCKALKPIRKNQLEENVGEYVMRNVLTTDFIEELTDKVLEIQEQELGKDEAAAIEKQLKGNQQKQRNVVSAIEAGGGNALVKRLTELEAEADELEMTLAKAKLKKPRLTREIISSWLSKFSCGDVDDELVRNRLFDTFIARVEVWNDCFTVYMNISGDNTVRFPFHIVD